MNIENINRLIAALEHSKEQQAPIGFNMSWLMTEVASLDHPDKFDKTGHACGTVACIAGWAVNLEFNFHQASVNNIHHRGRMEETAAAWLGIEDPRAANLLFYPDDPDLVDDDVFDPCFDYDDIQVDDAIEVLRHLRDTGEVDWVRVLSKE